MSRDKERKNSTIKKIAVFFVAIMVIQMLIYFISANSKEMYKRVNKDAEKNLYNPPKNIIIT